MVPLSQSNDTISVLAMLRKYIRKKLIEISYYFFVRFIFLFEKLNTLGPSATYSFIFLSDFFSLIVRRFIWQVQLLLISSSSSVILHYHCVFEPLLSVIQIISAPEFRQVISIISADGTLLAPIIFCLPNYFHSPVIEYYSCLNSYCQFVLGESPVRPLTPYKWSVRA